MRLNCVECGNFITLDDRIYADFDGPVKCNACSSMLHISMEEGKLRTMEFVKKAKPGRHEAGVK